MLVETSSRRSRRDCYLTTCTSSYASGAQTDREIVTATYPQRLQLRNIAFVGRGNVTIQTACVCLLVVVPDGNSVGTINWPSGGVSQDLYDPCDNVVWVGQWNAADANTGTGDAYAWENLTFGDESPYIDLKVGDGLYWIGKGDQSSGLIAYISLKFDIL